MPFEEEEPGVNADVPGACGCRLSGSNDRKGPAGLLLLLIGLSLSTQRRR